MKAPENTSVQDVIKRMDEQYQKYRFMEANLVHKKRRCIIVCARVCGCVGVWVCPSVCGCARGWMCLWVWVCLWVCTCVSMFVTSMQVAEFSSVTHIVNAVFNVL